MAADFEKHVGVVACGLRPRANQLHRQASGIKPSGSASASVSARVHRDVPKGGESGDQHGVIPTTPSIDWLAIAKLARSLRVEPTEHADHPQERDCHVAGLERIGPQHPTDERLLIPCSLTVCDQLTRS